MHLRIILNFGFCSLYLCDLQGLQVWYLTGKDFQLNYTPRHSPKKQKHCNKEYYLKTAVAGHWWCTLLILALKRQRQTDIQVQDLPGLHRSDFWAS